MKVNVCKLIRRDWGLVKPVTRIKQSAKLYTRKNKNKQLKEVMHEAY